MSRPSRARRKKTPADLVRDFASEFRAGISAAAFVIWCEVLRQEVGCLKSEHLRFQTLDRIQGLLTHYLSALPAGASAKESIAQELDRFADDLERSVRYS